MSEIKYPITINKIEISEEHNYKSQGLGVKCGDLVKIRPCDSLPKNKGKTYLGIFIGDIAPRAMASYHEKEQKLLITPGIHNPAIFIPEINKVVFGYESWWSKIKDESELKDITDNDIATTWYVRAMKDMIRK
jgi:hypothetical protein